MDTKDYERLMRDTPAPWQKDGQGLRGVVEETAIKSRVGSEVVDPVPQYQNPDRIVVRPPPYANPFPPSLPVPASIPPTIDINTYAFKMIDATNDPKNPIKPPSRAILIFDGQVSDSSGNPQFPSGMGNDDFYLAIEGDGYQVWCEITYDSTTLAITSASIAQGSSIPPSTLGDMYVLLGTITIDPDGTLTPHNTQCGDINIAFVYGSNNGVPALFILSQLDVPQPIV